MKQMDFRHARVLVCGDVMLDRYWRGSAERISPEAPVPVVRIQADESRPGGAANVAMNLAALGVDTTLLGIRGDDPAGVQLTETLAKQGVETRWVTTDAGTICKLRVLSRHQQLIRLDFEQNVPRQAAERLAQSIAPLSRDAQALILSDYAKGALQQVESVISAARAVGTPVFVDPKGQDFSRYRGATLIKPNQKEFEQIVGPCASETALVEKGGNLMRELGLMALLITRSEHGMLLLRHDAPPYALKAQAQEVFDVTGAGDTVIAMLAAAYAAGEPLDRAAWLANEAASIVVRKVGTSVVTLEELQAHLRQKVAEGHRHAVLDEEALVARVREAQARGERVAMTNGCFDLLHPGHIRYLQEAAALGDRLVVAVNSDASVRRLKGPERPVMPLAARMEMLAALSCVDWVTAFEEDTPERLICAVRPDILVKGGDYRPDEIAGGRCVRQAGGEVRTLAFWDGFSTTDIVDRIRRSAP